MLKQHGYEKVICYTYGKPSSWESKTSKLVAERLGYPWHHIVYDKAIWRKWFHSSERLEYTHFSSELCSIPHFQDLPAVKELITRNAIPNDGIFIPGHSGDFLAGSHLPKEWRGASEISLMEVCNQVIKLHYILKSGKTSYIDEDCLAKIRSILASLSDSDQTDIGSIFECFDWQERQSKFIINSVRAYEFFGFEWRLPLWDSEAMDFWGNVPMEYRLGKNLYDTYLSKLFESSGVSIEPSKCKTLEKLKMLNRKWNRAVLWNFFSLRERLECMNTYAAYFGWSPSLAAYQLIRRKVNPKLAHLIVSDLSQRV
jgi:asparagine synthase (glutamine-hydrolysing)